MSRIFPPWSLGEDNAANLISRIMQNDVVTDDLQFDFDKQCLRKIMD